MSCGNNHPLNKPIHLNPLYSAKSDRA